MPNRIIKESALTSRDLDLLSDGAERLFWRMTVTADDVGRFDADPRVVLAKCFPLRIDRLKSATSSRWLTELVSAGIVKLYSVDDRVYGFFPSWGKHQRIYGLKSKFPEPPAECGNIPQIPAESCSYPVSEIRESRIDKSVMSGTDTGFTPERIQERWNTIPGVKPCKEIGTTIRERLQSRLKEHSKADWWDNIFQRVQASDFLCGRTNGTQGPFRVSLTWILAPKNLDKLLAGDYDPIASNGHGQSLICTKRVQAPSDRFLRSCGQPASPQSRPTEPRCSEHLREANQTLLVTHASN
jgi:hypothetical protein